MTLRNCGRPTKAGSPCKNPSLEGDMLGEYESGCRTHRTDMDQLVRKAYFNGHSSGFESGVKSGRDGYINEVNKHAREVEDHKNFRLHDRNGHQIVECGRYSYTWNGTPLKVGDKVLLPSNWVNNQQEQAVVTSLGTTYTGALKDIVRRIT